ncbi:BatD family protein [Nitrosomonas marina]|uniref:Oxygen tolerance n=1 Tax=Nitrosomonas marina TaxID=917 RepID=A0A1H8GVP5_9PROT|nr:BatD family protein [Nitrosomonas marina]SEN47880.1 Oxygen tolerance [Nitrosomonas marina]
MSHIKYFFHSIMFLFCLLLGPVQAVAALTAQLDRERITEGETVRLIIEAAGQISAMPDTRVLEQDFEIAGTMSGSRVNIINGKMDSRTTWTISLIPLRSGQLTIPPLHINNEYTPELTLQVVAASADNEPDAAAPIFLETSVDKTDPYVQGMVRYTQRVFFAVNLAQGSLGEPEHENMMVSKLGEDREYTTQRNGRSYTVIEREFVVFPQVSGKLVIPAAVLNAQIPETSNRQDPFFDRFFSSTRPVRLRGEAITLDVRPRPDQSKSPYWLPAEAVELHETWQPDNSQISMGEPVTRNISIKALGVTGEQLPELKLTDPEGFKLYPDRAQSNTQNQSGTVQGEKTLRLAYMPTQPGKYTLPAFTLHWWDTATDSEQVAKLPERTVEVLPAAGQQQDAATNMPDVGYGPDRSARQSTEQAGGQLFPADRTGRFTGSPTVGDSGWFWLALLFATLWLITLGLFWRVHRMQRMPLQPNGAEKSPFEELENARQARKRFLAACQSNNPQQARHLLLKWAACHWPDSPPRGLDELSSRLNDPAIDATLTQLDRVLYQNNQENWDGQELAKLITELPKTVHASKDDRGGSALPELYS